MRYVLVCWASAGSETLLSAGPSIIVRMTAVFTKAEQTDTTEARLAAYDVVRQMVAWLPRRSIRDVLDPGGMPAAAGGSISQARDDELVADDFGRWVRTAPK